MRRLLLLLLCLSPMAACAAEKGFTPLFNGRDLSGWVNVNCAPETWTARGDGAIVCTGIPTGALRTERQYENFILEAEWRHLQSGGNAGIFVWASALAAQGQPFLRAIEVQVLDHGYGNTEDYTTHGDVFPIHGSTMKPFGRSRGMRSFPSENRSRPSPEWNHYRIEAKDGTLRLHVNGKAVSGGENCLWRRGYLALESEGAPVEWRNVRLKELPPGNAAPEQSAPAAQGHRTLYNGLDLRGWKVPASGGWKAADWQLVCQENRGPGEALWTEEIFGDGEFILDCRAPEQAAGREMPAVLLRGPAPKGLTVPLEGLKPGQWRRTVFSIQGKEVIIRSEGLKERRLLLPEGAPARGALGLTGGAGAAFANLYLLETKPEPKSK